jgi:hypothetical protein
MKILRFIAINQKPIALIVFITIIGYFLGCPIQAFLGTLAFICVLHLVTD